MSVDGEFHAAGGSAADAVANMLRHATLTSVLTELSDSTPVPEPTVLRTVGYERAGLTDGGERGVWELELWVCRETADEAESAALSYERVLRTGQWRDFADAFLNRVVGIDTDAPLPAGRDASGRWLWKMAVRVTAERSFA